MALLRSIERRIGRLEQRVSASQNPPEVSAEEEARREAARESILSFTTYTKPDYFVGWHHRLMARYIDDLVEGRIRRLMIFAPPRSGKSQLTSIALPAYFLGRFPDARVLACSNVAKLAQGWNRKVKRVITAAPYKDLFPDTKVFGKNVRTAAQGQWLNNMDEFEIVDHTGGYRAAGVGMAIAGLGMDLGVIDDPIKTAAEARSETLRDAQWEWFTQDFMTRQMPGARVLITLTRWTWDDIVGRHLRLLEEGAAGEPWTILRLPAIAEKERAHPEDPREPGEALWPEWYPLSFLHPMRDANPFAFESLYQQNPTPREGALFHEASFQIIDAAPSRDQFSHLVRWWDKGYAANGDFSVGALAGLTHDRRMVVLDVTRVRLPPRKRNSVILNTAHMDREQWGHVRTVIEQPPGAGTETTDTLVKLLMGFPVSVSLPGRKKEERAEVLSDQCDAENVLLVRGPWNRAVIQESLTFPGGENDDQIDALTGCAVEFGLNIPFGSTPSSAESPKNDPPGRVPIPRPHDWNRMEDEGGGGAEESPRPRYFGRG